MYRRLFPLFTLCAALLFSSCDDPKTISGGECGDDILDPGEECDTLQYGESTCTSLGYYGGNLQCNEDCTFNRSSCEEVGHCGDGVIQDEFGEVCDGASLGTAACGILEGTYAGGTLTCKDDCTLDVTGCPRCGDGVIQDADGEVCDGSNLADQT